MNAPHPSTADTVAVTLRILAADSGSLTPAWVTLVDDRGTVHDDRGGARPGFPMTGECCLQLAPGDYQLTVGCGPLFGRQRQVLVVGRANQTVEVKLERHVDLRARGWFCFDLHNHIHHPATPAAIAEYLDANAIDGVGVCQPWACEEHSFIAHDGACLARYLEDGSTATARVFFGAEYPKTRFGHSGWLRMPVLDDPRGPYLDYHDVTYFENVAGLAATEHPSRELPFDREWPVNKLVRWRRRGGVNAALHPTSWWLSRDGQQVVTTNIAADYIYGLFAGGLYDTLVVMGYDEEHIFYQNLWFNLLNRGYHIAGIAESDGGLSGKHAMGKLRQYSHIGQDHFDRDRLCTALKAGHSFMTSGPLLFVTGENGALPGDVLPAGQPHRLTVEAHADSDPQEYLTWLVLYRNGEVAELIDFEAERPRRIDHVFELPAADERAWYVVKVYGSTRPACREFVDIMAYAARCEHEPHREYAEQIRQIAFSNPVYVEPADFHAPAEIRPVVHGVVRDAAAGSGIAATIAVSIGGEAIEEVQTKVDGSFCLTLPLMAELVVSSAGHARRTVNPVIHCQPIADLLDEVFAGRWALAPNTCWQPGQMPFSAFQFERLRDLLTAGLNWDIPLTPISS